MDNKSSLTLNRKYQFYKHVLTLEGLSTIKYQCNKYESYNLQRWIGE